MYLLQTCATKAKDVSNKSIKKPTVQLYKLCLASLITIGLTACGGGSSGSDEQVTDQDNTAGDVPNTPDTPTEPDTDPVVDTPAQPDPDDNGNAGVSLVGVVGFDTTDETAFASFSSSPITVPLQEVIGEFVPSTDTCEVTTLNLTTPNPIDEDTLIPDLEGTSISAGEVLTVTSPAGTFVELIRVQFGSEFDYELADGSTLPGPVPAGTVVNIPGDVFPAFNNIAVPTAENITNFAPNSVPISPSAEFTWTQPSNNAQSSIILVLTNDFSFANNEFTTVTCTLIDDGSFTLPTDIQTQLDPDFQATNLAVLRTSVNTVTQDNAAVIVGVFGDAETIGF